MKNFQSFDFVGQPVEWNESIDWDDFLKKQNQLQRDCKQQEMMV